MRVSDLMISNNYLRNINDIKDKISVLNRQILSGNKIEKPSDSPVGTSRLFKINDQLAQTETFQKNIQSSLSFLNETTFAMETMQSEVQNIIGKLIDLKNPINQGNLNLYADMIDNSIKILLDTANMKSDGKYIFGGTDYSDKPYGPTADNQAFQANTNTSGKINVKLSQSIVQNINIPGADLFNTVVSARGYFNKTDSIGTITNTTSAVFDNLGNEYQLQATYQKIANNTYQMSYDIIDSGGSTVFATPPSAKTLVFDNLSGNLVSVDGNTTNFLNEINLPSNKIQFNINFQDLSESNSSTSIVFGANQSTDIFNTLKQISNNLRNGVVPGDLLIKSVENFNSRLTAKQSEVGNTINQISTIDSMLNQQNFNLQKAAQDENGVDIARAVVDLQNQDYLLQVSQKLGAKLLPQTLLDYL